MALNIPEPNYQQLTDFSNRYRAEQDALLSRQRQEQEGLFGQYEQKIGSQEKLPALYTRLQNEAGLPELQQQRNVFTKQIYGVQNMLDRLDEDVTSRTQGTLTTEAQRRRMVGAEGETLNNQLGRLGTGLQPIADMYNQASQQVGNLLGLTQQQQQLELSPLQMRIEQLGDRFAREMTGFDNSRQVELNTILDKLQRERALADREWQRAAELARQEAEFARQKQLVQMQMSRPQIGTAASTSNNSRSAWNALGGGTPGLSVGVARPGQISVQGSQPRLQGNSVQLQGNSRTLQGGNVYLQGGR